jgi:hypothetical protein
MADRLYVVAETAQAYAAWCRSKQLDPHDHRLVSLYPLNHEMKIRGARRGVAFALVWWDPARIERRQPIWDMLDARDAVQLIGREIDEWLAKHPSTDELVKLALLQMLHDPTGRSGELDHVKRGVDAMRADGERLKHLERCEDAVVLDPVTCTQDATSTGSGFELLSAPIDCPHGEPLTALTSAYGIGGLLPKMIEIGQEIAEVRECVEEEGDDG